MQDRRSSVYPCKKLVVGIKRGRWCLSGVSCGQRAAGHGQRAAGHGRRAARHADDSRFCRRDFGSRLTVAIRFDLAPEAALRVCRKRRQAGTRRSLVALTAAGREKRSVKICSYPRRRLSPCRRYHRYSSASSKLFLSDCAETPAGVILVNCPTKLLSVETRDNEVEGHERIA